MPVTAVNVFKDEIMAEEGLIRDEASPWQHGRLPSAQACEWRRHWLDFCV